jgi:hypothetical protein
MNMNPLQRFGFEQGVIHVLRTCLYLVFCGACSDVARDKTEVNIVSASMDVCSTDKLIALYTENVTHLWGKLLCSFVRQENARGMT